MHVDGIIGNDLIIRSLPKRIHDEVLDKFDSESNDDFPAKKTHHVVIKSNNLLNMAEQAKNVQESAKRQKRNSNSNGKSDAAINTVPDTVYPQLLITVDYKTFDFHEKNVESLTRYIAGFWNAVDLRYRELSNPKVRLNIAGLIIPQHPKGANYFESYTLGSDAILGHETLYTIGEYFAKDKHFPKDTYDLVVGMTYRDMVKYDAKGVFTGITGCSLKGGACKTAALVSDRVAYASISTAAHELAHSFDAPHDGPDSANIVGGPCDENDGYSMSYNRMTEKGFHWSNCSITAMRDFFQSDNSSCLRNKPDVGIPYPKFLPGRLMDRDQQCSRLRPGFVSYEEEEHNCAVLYCLYNLILIVQERRPPAEGTSCGENAICINGKCVKDPEAPPFTLY